MTGRRLLCLATALALATLLSGCGSLEMARLGHGMARAHPEVGLRAGYALSAGPVLLGLARSALGPDAPPEAEALRSVRRVQIGYFPASRSADPSRFAMPAPLARYAARGWEHVATVREDSSAVWVLARARRDRLTDVLVTVWSDEALVMTRISGDLAAAAVAAAGHALARPAPAAPPDTLQTVQRPPVQRPPVQRPPVQRPPVQRPPVQRPPVQRP
ncbi:MAG: DUF4252 domain-containing protein [Rubricoccaceae bacterium]